MFKITKVMRVDSDTVRVSVRCDSKEWAKLKAKGQLGFLYGTDISNAAYHLYGVKAYNPTVSDRDRASGGCKYVTLEYRDSQWVAPCESCEVYGDHCPKCAPMPLAHVILMSDYAVRRSEIQISRLTIAALACEVIKVDFKLKRRIAA